MVPLNSLREKMIGVQKDLKAKIWCAISSQHLALTEILASLCLHLPCVCSLFPLVLPPNPYFIYLCYLSRALPFPKSSHKMSRGLTIHHWSSFPHLLLLHPCLLYKSDLCLVCHLFSDSLCYPGSLSSNP